MARFTGTVIVGCVGISLASCFLTLYATGIFSRPGYGAISESAAILWLLIPWLILAICLKMRSRRSFALCAALAAVGAFISIAEDFHGRGGAGAVGDGLLLGRGGVLAYILLCAIIIAFSARLQNYSVKPAILAAFLTFASLMAGWWIGLHYWSTQMPSKILRDARNIAGVAPFCLASHRGPLHARSDLNGLNILSRGNKGVHWQFHLLLKVERNAEAYYYNWSHRASAFQPINQHARDGLKLDKKTICDPRPQFAAALSG